VKGNIDAPRLTLPSFDVRGSAPLPLGALSGWQGQLHVTAAQVLYDLRPAATDVAADFALSGGVLAAQQIVATVNGGHLLGAAALAAGDTPMLSFRGDLQGAALSGLNMPPPMQWMAGTADISVDASAVGHSPAALLASISGTATGALHEASLAGADLPRLTSLLAAREPGLRAGLIAALAGGESGKLSGGFSARLDHGAIELTARGLQSDQGEADIADTLDLPAATAAAVLSLRPAVAAPPTILVRASGPWGKARRTVDVADALRWAGIGKRGGRHDK